jgi:hypothetical protein
MTSPVSDDASAIIDAALERHECVLERGGERRVLLLDGSSVITEGDGAQRDRHLDGGTAREAFRRAILDALAEGFTAAPRDPPKRTTFVQPQRAPEVIAPVSPVAPRGARRRDWLVEPPNLRVTIDPFDGADWEPLFDERPDGVTFIDIEGEHSDDALELVLHRGLPTWTKGLGLLSFDVVEDYCAARLDPSAVWPLLTALETLELRAGASITLPPAPLPALRHLGLFTSEATHALVQSLATSTWAQLTSLELFLDSGTPLDGRTVVAQLTAERFPALRHLALRGVEQSAACVELLEARGLTSLTLTHGDVDGGFGRSPFAEPHGIEVLSENRFFPLRSSRFRMQ